MSQKLPEIPRSFYFVRHGETDWNKIRRMQGSSDIPLNETGLSQAQKAAEIFAKYIDDIHHIHASSLGRAFETANIINQVLNKPIKSHDTLWERHYGIFEGTNIDDFLPAVEKYRDPDLISVLHSQEEHQIECFHDFSNRIFSTLEQEMIGHNDTLLITAHNGVFACLHNHLTGSRDYIRSENCVPYLFEKTDRGWNVIQLD